MPKSPPVPQGMKRQWVRCKEKGCGWVGYYDYTPHGLANPIRVLGCGHGLTIRFSEAVTYITQAQAFREIRK